MSEAAASFTEAEPHTGENDANSVSPSEVENKSDNGDSRYTPNKENKPFPIKINKDCWFYLNGHCRYGRNCKYRHPRLPKPNFRNYNPGFARGNQTNKYESQHRGYGNYSNRFSNNTNNYATNNYASSNASKEKNTNEAPRPVANSEDCEAKTYPKLRRFRVFTNSNRYAQQNIAKPTESSQTSESGVFQSQKIKGTVMNPRQPLLLSSVNKEDLSRFRETEILQLKKRYPNLEAEPDADVFVVSFSSSDPDWAFDLKSLTLEIGLPNDYPKEPCDIKVVEDEQMPPGLQKYLNHRLGDWISERHETLLAAGEAELVLRPFFRWLDRNLEQFFIEGLRRVKQDIDAKRAGIEFVPYESLPGASRTDSPDVDEQKENIVHHDEIPLATEKGQENEGVEEERDEQCNGAAEESTERQVPGQCVRSSGKKGTEIKLLNFELKDSAASLQCQKLAVVVRCTRCKAYNEMPALSKQKHHSTACPKCHQLQEASFQPLLLHVFSSILGYLHLVGCQAVDLPLAQCSFYIDCLNCNKQNITDGIHYGQNHSMWCFFCNRKLCVSAHSSKFTLLQPIERQTNKVAGKKMREPLIEVGKPLPDNGTCRHYKKSFRWLRFPCCGKAYACDMCHNEIEIDHEMKYATRMICGLCGKEQPYSKGQPCVHCSSLLTNKSTAHWEGGKGCRDRIKMSREDKQKYAGTNKTVSKKAYALQPKKTRA